MTQASPLLAAALGAYESAHGPVTDQVRRSIARLIAEEGSRFDADRWARCCRRAARRLRGRWDIAVADYRRGKGLPPGLAKVDRADYARLLAESEAAEAERAERVAALLGQHRNEV